MLILGEDSNGGQKPYLIIKCYSCGNLLLAIAELKTRHCNYCNTRLRLNKVKVIAKAKSSAMATRLIIALKTGSRENW